ncbi:crotonase/enoyl-CoA hydratase family protein [Alphaproteobacteria bacterium]|jgi:enoyl-CoA hydratase/carnithine racemase|nr:crotonase/enoyl-CoA hydratase family protein [PS1 clade bacterium]MDA8624837.1 crotonase/enoyl-CoA hydratase family protein [Alphaproteobacteria bacterium]MBL6784605.1 crotonase/enoyl-CoA hydratase family protein [PS1 clade bacterium]MDA8643129.1 crotonase/enoyl-CoA hydratase family protein [Alphaproteobacteria bacterium]MDA8725726.1 crotonase/enoyl-CoA hydratase family protein [Alphaproteobacteria bacterium]
MTNYKQIKTEIDENGIMVLTLCRPEAMNAFTGRMMHEMIDALDKADADDAVRAIIVTGDGERAFCAGADLSEGDKTFDYAARSDGGKKSNVISDGDEVNWSSQDIRDSGGILTLRIYDSIKPIIGAINGAAVGIGVTMQLPMDVRIASDNARFGFVFARRGIVPEACSSWFLPRIVGISQALQWCYSGEVFGAEEALRGGLVSEIVPPADLLARAKEVALQMTQMSSPVSVAMTRQMLWRMMGADHPMEAHKVDSKAVFGRGRQSDAKEGVMSFLEKRTPEFADKPSSDMPGFYPWWDERKFS